MEKKGLQAIICLVIGAVLTWLDQWTKQLVAGSLMGKDPYVVIDGIFELWYSENRGAAFGMLQGQQTVFFIIAMVVFAGVIYVMWKAPANLHFLPLRLCLAVIAAGACGNLIDRVGQKYVVDFLYFKPIDFPIFNVADIYVTCGTGILFLLLMFVYTDADLDLLKPAKKG